MNLKRKIQVNGPIPDHARRMSRMLPQRRPGETRRAARYARACDAFVDEWGRHGFAPFGEPADVLAALQRVLAGDERFPKPLFLAARRFQRVRP
jgi:hypothetical protein